MTDGKPPPSAASSGPIAKELAEWLRAIRSSWTAFVPDPLSIERRRLYACAGSFTWMVGMLMFFTGDPRLANLIFANVTSELILLLYSLWFGWLVAFAERKSGPIRLFLDGLLLPAATVSIIGFSVGRVSVPTSAEPAQSRPITLVRESPASAQSSPEDEGADSESLESSGGGERR